MYGENYGYRSGLNRSMISHLQAKAAEIKKFLSLSHRDIVLDIGSNDATLLRAMDGSGARRVGMDPTGIKFLQYYPADVQLIADFFSANSFRREFGRQRAKVITSIAMFYDLENPLEFARDVSEILTNDGIWVFEQSYLPTMLAKTSYDTVCHEHLEYYALKQVLWMLERTGLVALDMQLNDINGGSFSIMAAKKESGYRPKQDVVAGFVREEESLGLHKLELYRRFQERVLRHREELAGFLDDARRSGEMILGYGASTKGNVILQFCGITPSQLPYIAEVNTDKFGRFTPGGYIPIIAEEQAMRMNPSGFLVLPWHFRNNIVAKEDKYLRGGGKLIFPLPTIEAVTLEKSSGNRL